MNPNKWNVYSIKSNREAPRRDFQSKSRDKYKQHITGEGGQVGILWRDGGGGSSSLVQCTSPWLVHFTWHMSIYQHQKSCRHLHFVPAHFFLFSKYFQLMSRRFCFKVQEDNMIHTASLYSRKIRFHMSKYHNMINDGLVFMI